MRWIIVLLIVCFITNCNNSPQAKMSDSKINTESVSQDGSVDLEIQIKNFETTYGNLEKQLYDSVSKVQNDGIDYSDITGGLEARYKKCNNEFEKILLGYKLAGNYFIHFDSSKDAEYCEKSKPLFLSFISFNKGAVAAQYLKLDISKVHYIEKEWDHFSEPDKREILLYGLLRGFSNGIPDVLKKIVD